MNPGLSEYTADIAAGQREQRSRRASRFNYEELIGEIRTARDQRRDRGALAKIKERVASQLEEFQTELAETGEGVARELCRGAEDVLRFLDDADRHLIDPVAEGHARAEREQAERLRQVEAGRAAQQAADEARAALPDDERAALEVASEAEAAGHSPEAASWRRYAARLAARRRGKG